MLGSAAPPEGGNGAGCRAPRGGHLSGSRPGARSAALRLHSTGAAGPQSPGPAHPDGDTRGLPARGRPEGCGEPRSPLEAGGGPTKWSPKAQAGGAAFPAPSPAPRRLTARPGGAQAER